MATSQNPNATNDLNLAELGAVTANTPAAKKNDTLFGPNIGIVSGGPAWTEALGGKETKVEEISLDVVKQWIARSKEPNQPTTTLQALVNLKRPTLRLTPLKPSTEDEEASGTLHALEFEYDADAPQCAITVNVVLPPEQRLADEGATESVFETTTEGGFGKTLVLDHGAHLELGRYEHTKHPATVAGPTADDASAAAGDAQTNGATDQHRRASRFSFHLRPRRSRAPAGPALAVVDAESQGNKDAADKAPQDAEDEGVKVVIRLSARDAAGAPLPSANEQVTYLHIVRFGAAPSAPAEGGPAPEDTRPWVVKVVKREAIIGPHVFHLHEIYGLSAHASSSPAPAVPPPAAHTYPPTGTVAQPVEEEPSSECLLCLSAPREVVLLPCRHLVACKDCALNMIEFGAGGTIHHPEETEATGVEAEGEGATPAGESPGAEAASTPATPTPTAAAAAAPAPVPIAPRRKRKAKGWFCPVCRQPYTSLLRITTTPPDEKESAEKTEEPQTPVIAEPPAAVTANSGPLATLSRPGFLRGFSLGNRGAAATTAPADVERGA